ncbi:hypothetical protein PR048_006884 [Dryococelus australis]|uniref:Uncharacterized protein n=1 Tax=Dryococelus australis TaxID=614101 RepID=A0ABQ9ICA6_9NEOP|nr:hypothetical protein PR048_006884 [Dryococelus australis]
MMNPLLYLLENNTLRRQRRSRRRCEWVNQIYLKLEELGEFFHLFNDLKNNPARFFNCFRMGILTFYFILDSIKPVLIRDSIFRRTISPEECLAVTLRYEAGRRLEITQPSTVESSPVFVTEGVLPFKSLGVIVSVRNTKELKKGHLEVRS